MVLQEEEDHARSKTRLCITICKLCTWNKHSLKILMEGEIISRSHHPTHASIKWMLNKEDTAPSGDQRVGSISQRRKTR